MSTKQLNPATGELLSTFPNDSAADLPATIAAARVAQQQWGALSYKQRAASLYTMKAFLAANADRAAVLISKCNGKTTQDALAAEVLPSIMACDWYAKNTAKALKSFSLPTGHLLFANKRNYIEYTPLGVVGIITPWNYPFSTPFLEVLMALMAGNAVVLKVATQTVAIGAFLEEVVNVGGGLPKGLFSHVVIGGAEVGPGMLSSGINKVFFTGSIGVGKKLMAEASKTLTPLSLELGGKDPMLVLPDASIERSVNAACWAGYQNAGQSCGGVERIYVHESLYDEFVAALVAKTKALRHGVPTEACEVDIGSLTTKGQLDTITRQVDKAVAAGAVIAAQSRAVGTPETLAKGYFYPATVLTNVTADMEIMIEETFGPILPVMKFRTIDEVVALANDCTMALTASIFTGDVSAAKRLASRLEAGVVSINDHLCSHGFAETPWGGWKESGIGRTHGFLGLKEMVNARCVSYELVPQGWIPRNMWWYPFNRESYEGILTGVRFCAPTSVGEFLKSAVALVAFAVARMFSAWKVRSEATSADEATKKQQ